MENNNQEQSSDLYDNNGMNFSADEKIKLGGKKKESRAIKWPA